MVPRRNESSSCETWPNLISSLAGTAQLERNAVDAEHRLCKYCMFGFFKLYTHVHIKPMYSFLWVLFFNTLFPFTSILVQFLVRATSLTCAFRMPGYKGRATYESFGNAQKTAVQICINCAETFKFCKLCVGEIKTRNGNNYIRVKKEFLLEGKLGEQILSLSIWLDLIVMYDKL